MHKSSKEVALIKFNELKDKYRESQLAEANEATTRLLLIDSVLELLGWEKDEFNPESYESSSGFADYLIKLEDSPRLVLEAKKTGVTFSSPKNKLNKNEYSISYFKQAFKRSLTETINQASDYCLAHGVPYSIITNGAEWILLQIFPTPGVAFDNMKGVYFGNLFFDDFYFDHFWELLSKQALANGSLETYFSELNYSPSEVCRLIKADYGVIQWTRPERDKYIDEFYESFFSEITNSDQRKMLEYCFVADSKLSQFKGDLKRLLKDTTPNFLPPETNDLEPSEGKKQILSESNTGKVVIIAGSVGCGKSTLVTKSIIEAKMSHKDTITPMLVDLIFEVGQHFTNASKLILEKINSEIEKNYPSVSHYENLIEVFNQEIRDLQNSSRKKEFELDPNLYIKYEADLLDNLRKNTEKFVIGAIKKLTGDGNNVIIVIDNVDRASEAIQEEVYTLACKISSLSGATVIITMREFTYFKNKSSGFLDVRSSDRVIHLKAPDFEKLISRRIKYIENHFEDDFRIKSWRTKYDLEQFRKSVIKYKNVLKNSLQLSEEGTKILETLSSISWHNIRYFYDLLKRVHLQLGSANVTWSHSEIITSLMISREQGESAIIPNIFIPFQGSNRCYFSKVRLLLFLNYSVKANEKIHGVHKERIISHLRLYGYMSNWVRHTIEEAVKQRLIECLDVPNDDDDLHKFELQEGKTFRISPLGIVVLSSVVKNKTYLSLVAADLPIHSNIEFNKIKDEYDLVFSYMGDKGENVFYKDGIDILEKSQLSSLVANYLLDKYREELPANSNFEKLSEVSLSENKIKDIFPKEIILNKSYSSKNPVAQMDMLSELDSLSSVSNHKIDINELIPENIHGLKHDGSEFIPLIFCALVIERVQGKEVSFGVDITKSINNFIVPPENEKFTNNVSRALRSKKLMNQKWLKVRKDVHPKFAGFTLEMDWKEQWLDVFKEPINLPSHLEF